MKRIAIGIFVLAISALILNCGAPANSNSGSNSATSTGIGGESPTDAYKKLYAAVKAKDTEAIKAVMTRGTMDFARTNAARTNQTVDQILVNGFTATTFSPSLPQIRDERIDGDMGAVEVYNSKDNRWEDLPFIREDGTWKFAIGDMWFGKFKSPGKGQAQKEAEAANLSSNRMIEVTPNANANFRSGNKSANSK
jgi:hypothetical protein